ncbi:hypothetical protein OM076_42165 [Solirubrobacter ginsenosidimutans]|uniref:Uncharacterized protein n=1 Tax=Solirubrobacter ginsenosidimutans TaxID=490573 RepID=A0A9X3N1K0_9ACTN|nr:hypothetical protein [Solirubrobacter ginsenosidimutans]MDA0166941.1 hypothetical protein [Solirubrobacter ginsenosidimutans]
MAKIGLFPPKLQLRSLEMAAAQTRVLVDSPKSSILDLAVSTNDIRSTTNRALLISNVMASAPVREYIARRSGVPVELLQIASPVTPDFARPLAINGPKPHTTDILRSPKQYRLSLASNPTVPMVDVYAEAPDATTAQHLANGAVDGMRDYLRDLGNSQHVPLEQRVNLEQLGRAKGGPINTGVNVKVGTLTFVLVLAASCAALLYLSRVRKGWLAEAGSTRPNAASEPAL